MCLVVLPVNKSVAGDRQQLPAVFVVKGASAVRILHTSRQSAQTCREDALQVRYIRMKPSRPNHVTAARYSIHQIVTQILNNITLAKLLLKSNIWKDVI